jgi:hypothetical protein
VNRTVAIVTTTIFEPAFLAGYERSIRQGGWDRDTTLFVIPDRKTPASVAAAAADAARRGLDVRCPDLAAQDAFLASCAPAADFVPYDSDNRRNVGFLMALEAGCDVLISIDDDNYVPDGTDFVRGHLDAVGADVQSCLAGGDIEISAGAWFNACEMLELATPAAIFPRGFPYKARRLQGEIPGPGAGAGAAAPPEARVAINAGLWREDPDVDAVTRLALAPRVVAVRPPSVVLGPGVWAPINTQNTALSREAAEAYYYVRMGYAVGGLQLDRFGDILSGYFVQKCAKHLGETIRFGTPVVDHRRTPHDLLKDLYHELAGIALVEDLVPWLREVKLTGTGYRDAYGSLADCIDEGAGGFKGFFWESGGREFLRDIARHMRTWRRAIQSFG